MLLLSESTLKIITVIDGQGSLNRLCLTNNQTISKRSQF